MTGTKLPCEVTWIAAVVVIAGCSSDEGSPLAVITDPVNDDPIPISTAEVVVENPTPPAATIFAMECLGPGALAAAGEAGFAAVREGGTWRVLPTGTSASLNCAWGTSTSDVYFAGDGGCFLHWDGVSLSSIDAGTDDWWDMWGDAASGEIWLVDVNAVSRWDGSTATRYDYPAFPYTSFRYGVGGSGASDVYIVGNSGNVAHWDGAAWTSVSTGLGTTDLRSIEVVGGEIFIAGRSGQLWRFDGASWSSYSVPTSTFDFTVVCGIAADDVWAFGYSGLMYHWDGAAWSDVSDPYFISSYAVLAACVGPNGGVAVGGAHSSVTPNVSRYAGAAWSSLSSSSIAPNTLNDVCTFDENFAVAVGENGAVVQRDASGWTDVPHGLTTEDLWGVWASGPTDIWAVGNNGVVLHGDGSTWSLVDTGPDDFDQYGVGGNAPDSVWIVGSEALWHWDGAAWTNRLHELPDTSSSYNKVWVAPTGEVFLAGDDFVRFDGTTWERIPVKAASGGAYLYDVWGTSANDVWVTGYPGVFHWDGAEVALRWFTGSDDPVAITGTSSRNVLACGEAGVVQFADGIPAQIPARAGDLVGAGTGADGVTYLVGEEGIIVRVE